MCERMPTTCEPFPEFGIIIDDVKYLPLFNSSLNNLKKKSLNDNIYFTMRDIFRSADTCDICIEVNYFNEILTNNVYLEDRTDSFTYSDALYDISFVEKLMKWLDRFNVHYLAFEKITEEHKDYVDLRCYIKFEQWMTEFNQLKADVRAQYEMLKQEKA